MRLKSTIVVIWPTLAFVSVVLSAVCSWADQKPQSLIPNCSCKQVEVFCSDAQKKAICGDAPAACVTECKAYFKEKVCSDFELRSGTIEMERFQERVKKCKSLIQSRPSFDDNPEELVRLVSQCSEIVHEMFHLCVPTFTTGGKQLACEEWGGKNTEAVIYSKSIDFFCADESKRLVDGKLSPTCKHLCSAAYDQYLMSGWLKCLCDAVDTGQGFMGLEDWLTKPECCSCRARCLKGDLDGGYKFFPDYCLKNVDREKLTKWLEPVCNQLSFDPQHYSCGKMARDGQKQFGTSCP